MKTIIFEDDTHNPQDTQEEEAEQDIVLSFGGKSFHYLDPQEMMKEAMLRKRQQEACKRDDMQAFMTNLELDNLYGQLDDELVDNDDSFPAFGRISSVSKLCLHIPYDAVPNFSCTISYHRIWNNRNFK